MKKLYIKQKVFSWADHFTVKNEYDEDCYTVQGEAFSFGKKLHLCDMTGTELMFLRQKVWSWLPCYHVLVQDRQVAQVVREVSFFRPRFRVDGPGWQVEGEIWEHQYRILQGERVVATVQKAWFTWGDSYELQIQEDEDERLALAVVLAIDCAAASAAAATAASSN